MTDVTTSQQHDDWAELSAADEQLLLLRELTERARTDGLRLTGEGGLLGKLTKMVVEGALEGRVSRKVFCAGHEWSLRPRMARSRAVSYLILRMVAAILV